jgi:hypothetical protein
MSEPQHRDRPRVRSLVASAIAVLVAAALGPAAGPGSGARAAQSVRSLPGSIPQSPPYVTGFPIPFFRTTDYRDRMGAVAAADLDRDGRLEIVASVPSGVITVIGTGGVRRSGWPRAFHELEQPAFPVGGLGVGDLDGDGLDEIVSCVVSGAGQPRSYLYALRHDGTDLPGWPVPVHGASGYDACSRAGVRLADLDGDGRPEAVRSMGGGMVVALRADGRPAPGWPFSLGPDAHGRRREINADLEAADLDGDGAAEIVLLESGLEPRLAAVKGDGSLLPGFPVILPEVADRQRPLAADLDGDGRPELVAATLPFTGELAGGDPAEGTPILPAALRVMRPDGGMAPGWPRPLERGAPWGPIAADVTGDGRPEILQADGDGLLAFDPAGNLLPGFPLTLQREFLRSQGLEASPWLVADLDGDARPDLLQAHSNLYEGSAYLRVFGVRPDGRRVRGFPFDGAGLLHASRPVWADVSGDGFGDLVMLTADGTYGGWLLIAWDLGALRPGR